MMTSLAEKALNAKRESKSIDFKQNFDCESKGEWCEVIKDLVAMANSGGGIVVFGLGNNGEPVGFDCTKIAALDPADVANKIGPYIGSSNFPFSVIDLRKGGCDLVGFLVEAAITPYVFERPGSYTDPLGKQKSAFALGTTYFRHNAKSEPGTNEDLRKSISRQVEQIRREWTDGLRKVVEAPPGSELQVITSDFATRGRISTVRAVTDQSAQQVRITRDPSAQTDGTIFHEAISEAIFEEINNVIETNRLLATGRNEFLLGIEIYYRIYAERDHVRQTEREITQLFHTGVSHYCPTLFWCSLLPDEVIASQIADLVLLPRGNAVHTLLRMTPLLGIKFYKWLAKKFDAKWGNNSQRPQACWTLQKLESRITTEEPRLVACKLGLSSPLPFSEAPGTPLREVLSDGSCLNTILSQACMEVFAGKREFRSVAREFDYLTNCGTLIERGPAISALIQETVGDKLPVDIDEIPEAV